MSRGALPAAALVVASVAALLKAGLRPVGLPCAHEIMDKLSLQGPRAARRLSAGSLELSAGLMCSENVPDNRELHASLGLPASADSAVGAYEHHSLEIQPNADLGSCGGGTASGHPGPWTRRDRATDGNVNLDKFDGVQGPGGGSSGVGDEAGAARAVRGAQRAVA